MEEIKAHRIKLAESLSVEDTKKHITALAKIGSFEAIKTMMNYGFTHPSDKVKDHTREALLKIPDKALDPLIEYGCTHHNVKFVDYSRNTLKMIGRKGLDALLERVKGSDNGIRGDDKAVPVRLVFLATLENIADDKSVRDLIELTKEEKNEQMISLLAHGLGDFGDKRAIDTLIGLLKHKDPIVLESSIIALGQICDRKALAHLMRFTGHEDSDIDMAAKDAIKKIQEANK